MSEKQAEASKFLDTGIEEGGGTAVRMFGVQEALGSAWVPHRRG